MSSLPAVEFEIRSRDERATLEIARAVGMTVSPFDISFSRWRNGELMGGVVYQRYTHASVLMHVAGFMPNWVNRDFLWLCFHYPFEQLGVGRVFGLVHEKNEEALRFDQKLGFEIETRIKKVYPDGDQIILVMEREKCRWLALKPKYIQSNRG